MSSRRSAVTRRERPISKRRRFGTFSFKSFGGWKLFTTARSYIEIWRVPIYSSIGTCKQNWVTWTSPRLLRKVYPTLKQELLITQALRFGGTCPMTPRVISGHLDVFCTRCARLFHHLEQMTCKVFTRKLLKASTQGYPSISVKRWPQLSSSCFKCLQVTGQLAIRSSRFQS